MNLWFEPAVTGLRGWDHGSTSCFSQRGPGWAQRSQQHRGHFIQSRDNKQRDKKKDRKMQLGHKLLMNTLWNRFNPLWWISSSISTPLNELQGEARARRRKKAPPPLPFSRVSLPLLRNVWVTGAAACDTTCVILTKQPRSVWPTKECVQTRTRRIRITQDTHRDRGAPAFTQPQM